MALGVHDYIKKPFTSSEIKIAIHKQIQYVQTQKQLAQSNLYFQTLLDTIPSMVWCKDINSNYLRSNRALSEHTGKIVEEMTGRNDMYVFDTYIAEDCLKNDVMVMESRKKDVFNECFYGKKGYKEFTVYKSPVINSDNEVEGTIGIAYDITHTKNQDATFQILIENLPFEVWLTDKNGLYVHVNSMVAQRYNKKKEEIIGTTVHTLHPPELAKTFEREDQLIKENRKNAIFETTILKDGVERIIEVNKTPIFDIGGQFNGIVGVAKDVTEVRQIEKKIKKNAYTDSLTGLCNRRALYKYMTKQIQKQNNPIIIMFLDLDNFKQINDAYGHHSGDMALKYVASILRSTCKNGFCARIGGDEFVVVFKATMDDKTISDKANSIISLITKKNTEQQYHYNVSTSIGIVKSNKETDVDQLLVKGDRALYKSKEDGKDRYTFYTQELENKYLLTKQLEHDLAKGLEQKEFTPNYQPLYTCEKNLVGFEALFRWNNSKYKHVPVIDIIKIMEKTLLMNAVSECICLQAFSFAKKINENRENKLVVSVNISALQIMKDDFVFTIKRLVKAVGVSFECIGIEVTETVLLKNIKTNIQKLKELKKLGIKISLDDFGTGYSSFNYLVQLPLSIIKIDRSFIQGMSSGTRYKKLIKLIIDAAHSLDLPVVAEGIESKEELDTLRRMGMDYIQGYYFSKPVSEKDAAKLL